MQTVLPWQSQNNDLNPRRTNGFAPSVLSAAHLHVYRKDRWTPTHFENTSSQAIPSSLYFLEYCYYSTGRFRPSGLRDFLQAKVNRRTVYRLQASQFSAIKIMAAITKRRNHGSGTVPDALQAWPRLFIARSLWGGFINPILQMRNTRLGS